MFEHSFGHYLSYGATDQQTVRDLTGSYTGLLVPGTVAAFQREGTGGFVLTLSATAAGVGYVIDPRFPLFQQALRQPKRSHEALADLMGAPDLVTNTAPSPSDFIDERIQTIAAGWTDFNVDYQRAVSSKFDKYAERLQDSVQPENARPPRHLLPPYLIAAGPDDPWWRVSDSLFDATRRNAGDRIDCVRVVAAAQVIHLPALLDAVTEERVIVWVSDLNEVTTPARDLGEYAGAIRSATERGHRVFALYGGFLSVLLGSFGLAGSSHGIGYGEYRHWVELPQSGPPPPRYYSPQLHRYISQEFAYQLWLGDPDLARCGCQECAGEPPIVLEYHSLMKHSVLCRSLEIRDWTVRGAEENAERLRRERSEFLARLERTNLSDIIQNMAERSTRHLLEWADALELGRA